MSHTSFVPVFEPATAGALPFQATVAASRALTVPQSPQARKIPASRRRWRRLVARCREAVGSLVRRKPTPALKAGAKVGRYRLISLIGAGGMGQVWEAEDRRGRRVALKIMRRDLWEDPTHRDQAERRFAREVRVTAQVASPHTPVVGDSGAGPSGARYYTMTLLPGFDLRELVDAHGVLPPARAARVLAQLCRALSAVHEAGFVHRDIKPENILLSPADHLTVVDFGIATDATRGSDVALTTESAIVGTPQYLAPEAQFGAVGPASDIYAVGCVAYFLLTGRAAFRGRTPIHVLDAHRQARRADLPAELPAPLVKLVTACLSRDPDERPPRADELAAEFEQLATEWTAASASAWWANHEGGRR